MHEYRRRCNVLYELHTIQCGLRLYLFQSQASGSSFSHRHFAPFFFCSFSRVVRPICHRETVQSGLHSNCIPYTVHTNAKSVEGKVYRDAVFAVCNGLCWIRWPFFSAASSLSHTKVNGLASRVRECINTRQASNTMNTYV